MNPGKFLTIPAEEYHAASRSGQYMSSHLLAPSIIESVIRGDYPANLSVNSTRKAVPDLWKDQVMELMK